MDSLPSIRCSFRVFRSSPLLFSVAVLSLGLGIFVSLTTFRIADLILFQPLPVRDPEQLALVHRVLLREDEELLFGYSAQDLELFAQYDSVEQLTWIERRNRFFYLPGDGPTRMVYYQKVAPGFFRKLGAQMLLGSGFSHDGSQAAGEVILSHRFWKTHYAESPEVIGQTLPIGGDPHVIAAVAPASMRRFSIAAEVWVAEPLDLQARGFLPILRLKPGLSLEAAQSEIAARYQQYLVDSGSDTKALVRLESLSQALLDSDLLRETPVRYRVLLLVALGTLVLTLGYSNTAHAVVLHGMQRRSELAVRACLGAERKDLLKQLLTEAGILVMATAALAVLAMTWLGNAVLELLPYSSPGQGDRMHFLYQLPIWELPAMGAASWLALALIIGLSLLAVGLLPALRLSRLDLAEDLKATSAAAGLRRGNTRLSQLFVANQVAFTFVILVAAGLFMRTVANLDHVPLGFNPDNVLHAELRVDARTYMTRVGEGKEAHVALDPRWTLFLAQLVEQVKALPGVVWATSTNHFQNWQSVRIRQAQQEAPLRSEFEFVDDHYFRLLEIPLLRGRNFGAQDQPNASWAVIVSQAFAQRHWADEDPLGKAFQISIRTHPDSYRPVTVIGVAADTRRKRLGEGPRSVVYLSYRQFPTRFRNVLATMALSSLLVRTKGNPSHLIPEIRKLVGTLSKDVALRNVEPLAETLNRDYAETFGYYRILVALGLTALLLALFGIFGVVSHNVRTRLHELGVRTALGARRADILRNVARRNLLILAIGLPLGTVLALWLSRYLASLLHGVMPRDPVTFLSAGLVVLATFLIATLIPVRRAVRSSPAEILREL